MTQQLDIAVAEPTSPGYYTDPLNPRRLRWHDGQGWTPATKYPDGSASAMAAEPRLSWKGTVMGWAIASSVYPVTAALLGEQIEWMLMASVAVLFGFIAVVRLVVAEFVRNAVRNRLLRAVVTTGLVFLITILALTAATLSGLDWRSIRGGGLDLAALTSWLPGDDPQPPPRTIWQPALSKDAAFVIAAPVPLSYRSVPGPAKAAGFTWSADRYLVRWQKAQPGGVGAHRGAIADLAADYRIVRLRPGRSGRQPVAALVLRAPDGSLAKGRAVLGNRHVVVAIAASGQRRQNPEHASRFLGSLQVP